MIRLRTLGTLDLFHSEGPEVRGVLAQPRRLALLVYLAVATPHGFHRRDRLLALFWPESDAEHARASLNRAIYFLRRELGVGVIVSRGDEEVGLDAGHLWCDAATFEELLDEGHPREALELYRGDLLPGFFTSNANGFEEWLENERARLRERASEAAWALAEAEEAKGDQSLAAHWARRGVELAPFREDGVRRLLALLDRAGDRAGAALAYKKFADDLSAELELAPSPETRALIDAIRSRQQARMSALHGESEPVMSNAARAFDSALDQSASASERSTTEAGAGSPPQSRRRIRGVGVTLAVLGVVAVGVIATTRARLDPHRVYVAPFTNRTGEAIFDVFGRKASEEIAQGLVNAGLAEIVSPGVDESRNAREDSGRRLTVSTAASHGAGTVVTGDIDLEEGTLRVRAWITDARHDRVLWAVPTVSAKPEFVARIVTETEQRALGAVAALMSPRFASWLPIATSPPTFAAFQEFVLGTDRQLGGEPRKAIEHFRAAVALDTTFTWALMQQAVAHMNRGQLRQADSIEALVSRKRDRMSPLQRLWLDWMVAMKAEDNVSALRAMRNAAKLAPDRFLYSQADNASYLNRPREVIDVLERLGPDAPYNGSWGGYWYHVTNAYHLLREHQRELSAAHRARESENERISHLSFDVPALAALHRTDQVRALLDTSLMMTDQPGYTPADLMLLAGQELRAHGHAEAAKEALDRAVAWYQSHDAGDNADEDLRWNFARALYLSRDWPGAEGVLRSLLARDSLNPDYIGMLGTIAARRGDRAAAERAVATLESLKPTLPRPRESGSGWQGKIVVLLGDSERGMRLMADALGSQGRGELHADFDFERIWTSKLFREFVRPKG